MRLILFFATCFALAGNIGAALAAPPDMRVNVHNGVLSVELGDGVPLGEVLIAIALQAGFRLTTMGNLGHVQPQAFTNVPVDRGIARLVGSHSLLIIHNPSGGHQTMVRVYEASHTQQKSKKPPLTPTTNVFYFAPTPPD